MTESRSRPKKHVVRFGAPPARQQRRRLGLLCLIFVAVFGVIVWKLAELQLGLGDQFTHGDLRHVGSINIPQPRGTIYDRRRQPLAVDDEGYSLCADPKRIDDPHLYANELSMALGLDRGEVLEKLSRKNRFAYIKRYLSEAEIAALDGIKEETEGALWLSPESVRRFPQRDLAAHVLGFVNRNHNGGAGVEARFNEYLRSTPGKRTASKDANGFLIASTTLAYEEPMGGADMFLTIDAVIQNHLENAIDRRLEEVEAPRGMGIVMDPRTGAILALAHRPAYDPNRFTEYDTDILLSNPAVSDVFEPGSVFKIVTAAAALEHDLITPETEFDGMQGRMRIGRRVIRDVHRLGIEPFRTCFAESSNIAMIQVAEMLGEERLYRAMRDFGFGQETCSDIGGESAGILRPPDKWSGYSMGSLPMGQEVSVTMPQLAKAFSVIANGGLAVDPYLVDRIVDREGDEVYRYEPETPRRVLREGTAATMRALSHLVVTSGTGSHANINSYRVGGKTGTAQVANPEKGGYYEDKYTAVFAGFAPISDPRLVCVIVVQEPGIDRHYGGYVCGPVFKDVVYKSLRYLHVPEDPVLGTVVADENKKGDPDTFARLLAEDDFSELMDVNLVDPLDDLERELSGIARPDAGPRLPNLRGLTKREALEKVAELDVQWDMQGSGWVIRQEPPPGTPLADVTLCRMVFDNRDRSTNDAS